MCVLVCSSDNWKNQWLIILRSPLLFYKSIILFRLGVNIMALQVAERKIIHISTSDLSVEDEKTLQMEITL